MAREVGSIGPLAFLFVLVPGFGLKNDSNLSRRTSQGIGFMGQEERLCLDVVFKPSLSRFALCHLYLLDSLASAQQE